MAVYWTGNERRQRIDRAADWRDRLTWWALGVLTWAIVVLTGIVCTGGADVLLWNTNH